MTGRDAVSAEVVLDTAARMLETDGVQRFSMRGLAETLGVAATSIYWHVGGRDKLFDSLVDRLLVFVAPVVAGDGPAMTGSLPGPLDLGEPELERIGPDLLLGWRLREV